MKYHRPTKASIFAVISPVHAMSELLGLAKGGVHKYIGGGVEEGETLEEALEKEGNQEAFATFNRANFGREQFNLNINIIHAKTVVRLVTPRKKLIRDPESHRGPCELKIMVRCQEVSGREPQAGQGMSDLKYYEDFQGLDVRNFVLCASTQRQKLWRRVEKTGLHPPTLISRKYLRDRMDNNLFIDPEYTDALLVMPPNPRGMPPPLQDLRV